MKVYIRSYKVPMVLIIVGGALLVMAGSEFTARHDLILLITGIICVGIGVMGWLSVQIGKYFKKRKKSSSAPSNTGSSSKRR